MDQIYETLIGLRRQVAAYAIANNDPLIANEIMESLNNVMDLIDKRKSVDLSLTIT